MSRLCAVVFASVVVVSLATDARAQAPVPPPSTDAPPAAPAPTGFSGSVTVGASVESGQTDMTGVQLGFEGRRPYSASGALTTSATYQYATTHTPDTLETITVADHIDAQIGVEHEYNGRWVLMARSEALRDTIKQIDYRFNQIIGLGPRLRKGRLQVRIIPGLAFISHDKNVTAESNFNVNLGFYEDLALAVSPGWMLNQTLYASQDPSDDNDYFASFSTQLTGAITQRLGLQLAYVHTYESLLPVGVDPRYQKVMVGLQLKF